MLNSHRDCRECKHCRTDQYQRSHKHLLNIMCHENEEYPFPVADKDSNECYCTGFEERDTLLTNEADKNPLIEFLSIICESMTSQAKCSSSCIEQFEILSKRDVLQNAINILIERDTT